MMASSLRTPTDVNDNALPASDRLFHPHNAHHRARFPSLTEFPDSPSVYSHAYPSPDIDLHADTLSHLHNHPAYPDLDDETASTIRSLSTEGIQDDSDVDDFTDDASHRISLQGPKIRFHSRAPWETDDLIPHPEEPDMSPRSGTFGSKLKSKASRADSLIRTFTRGSSLAGRPSIDSARSQTSSTSFEIPAGAYSSTRGALYDLARQSMSTTSLSSSTNSSIRNQRTPNYPEPPAYFPQTHGSLCRATVSLDGMAPPSLPVETVPTRCSSSDVSRTGRERSMKPFPVRLTQERHSSHDDFVHPYANPDLVVPSYTPSSESIPPSHHPIPPEDMSGSDSNCTITDSTSIRSTAFSTISPETSTTSLAFREGNLRVNGKEISSPICVLHQQDGSFVGRNTRFMSLHPPPPGFDAPQRINPTVTLLTLQEAQARERLRTNINTSIIRTKSSFSDAENIPETPEEQNEEIDTAVPLAIARSRTGSISAGTPQKIIPLAPSQTRLSEAEDSNSAASVSGRALKHKKSGFMRLFGGRNSEGEKERGQSPPALPNVDGFAELVGMAKPSRLTRPRVGKPASSPALRGPSASNPQLASKINDGDSPDGKGHLRRRQAPSLSIVTKTSSQSIATSSLGLSSPTGLKFTPSLPLSLTVPQSAPPGNGGFPGLQLRPVSGCFSAQFADIVTNPAEEKRRDVRTPSSAASSNNALSPFTPVSTRRSDDASATAMDAIGEENLTIKGLQDQLASANKTWQQRVWELQGTIRDLMSELDDLKAVDHCEVCGRGEPPKRQASPLDEQSRKVSVVDRPRVRTGHGARFANGT